MTTHSYSLRVTWTGNTGTGTKNYRGYSRAHEIAAAGKPVIVGSSDPNYRGDAARYNPEELLVASLSSCHMLWYLHLASSASIVVTDYRDEPVGTLREDPDGAGCFTDVLLRPTVTVRPGTNPTVATELHDQAHAMCFIANSVTFPVRREPRLETAPDAAGDA